MAWIQMYSDRDWRGAETSYARALSVAPGNALALSGAGVLAYDLGRLEESIGLYRRALEQDPLSSVTYNRLGLALFRLDRLAEAEAAFRKALELAPQRGGSRGNLAQVLLAQGRGEEALQMATEEPALWARLMALAIVHHRLGHPAESDAALVELTEKFAEHAALQIAEVHGARGEVDAAFEWLDLAHSQGDPGLSEMMTSLPFHSLHGDPRWSAFLTRMGLKT
jgi:tetratricopeptide (TPR) repeat protein